MFLSKLLPKEGNFFEMLDRHADCIEKAANAFSSQVHNYADESQREEFAKEVKQQEREADKVVQEVNHALHKTFITPIDREQLHQLVNGMDDVIDMLQDCSEAMSLYDLREPTEYVVELTVIAHECCKHLCQAVRLLGQLQKQETVDQTVKLCAAIDEAESNADRRLRKAMSLLFRQEQDVREIIKLKAIYELLEGTTDRCEDVANLIEGVVLENS